MTREEVLKRFKETGVPMTREELLKRFEEPIKVLDHGFIRLVDVLGNDQSILRAARVSYQGSEKKTTEAEDEKLIRYLLRHRHTSPFEMAEIVLHCKMPIFVARQWIRHRTANVNEVSGRYSVLPDEMYIPEANVVASQSVTNKQGRNESSDSELADDFIEALRYTQHEARQGYQRALDKDVARELARLHLPVSQYTEWYWKIDLRNLLHFLELRLDSHAQYEIRQYANAMAEIVKLWVPYTWWAFEEFVLNSVTLSWAEVNALCDLLHDVVPKEIMKDIDTKIEHYAKLQIKSNDRERKEFLEKMLTKVLAPF